MKGTHAMAPAKIGILKLQDTKLFENGSYN
jgi:hypothetical protein